MEDFSEEVRNPKEETKLESDEEESTQEDQEEESTHEEEEEKYIAIKVGKKFHNGKLRNKYKLFKFQDFNQKDRKEISNLEEDTDIEEATKTPLPPEKEIAGCQTCRHAHSGRRRDSQGHCAEIRSAVEES